MKLIIGNKNYSSWSLRPWLFLSYHQLDFEEVRIPMFIDNFKEKLQTYTEAGFVPVLQDKELTVWDSLAICEYISEQYLSGTGWPANPKARATARSCSAEMHSGFTNIRSSMPMNARATQRKVDISATTALEINRIQMLWEKLRLQNANQGPWLFGEFTIADCMFAPIVFRFHTYEIELSAEALTYMLFFYQHPLMQVWLEASKNELEIIDRSEAGIQV